MDKDLYEEYTTMTDFGPCITRRGGLFSGREHKFVARTEFVIDWEQLRQTGVDLNSAYVQSSESSFAETFGREVYIRDICVYCGAVRERSRET